jgi:mRNA deadenylase 3'-5' endonuclease subunit Ccr4
MSLHIFKHDEDTLAMHFFGTSIGTVEISLEMCRPYGETMGKTLKRLSSSVDKKMKGKSSKKAKDKMKSTYSEGDIPSPKLLNCTGGTEVDTTTEMNSTWRSGMIVIYRECTFVAWLDPPRVTNLVIYPKKMIFADCPFVPHVEAVHHNGIILEWESMNESPVNSESNQTGTLSDTPFNITPPRSVLGKRLKLHCTPWCFERSETATTNPGVTVCPSPSPSLSRLFGKRVTYYTTSAVQDMVEHGSSHMAILRRDYARSGPSTRDRRMSFSGFEIYNEEESIADLREFYGSSPGHFIVKDSIQKGVRLRVMSYNILAEPYATSESAYTRLYPYIADKLYLETEFRIQLILEEILASGADILCLQETDCKVFNSFLRPILQPLGYSGHYTNKGGSVNEGCSMFTRAEKLRPLCYIDCSLRELIFANSKLSPWLNSNQRCSAIKKVGTCCQIGIFSVRDPENALSGLKLFVVANTHLFYHPKAAYIRLLQVHAILSKLWDLKEGILEHGISYLRSLPDSSNGTTIHKSHLLEVKDSCNLKDNIEEISLMLAGDLNSTPETAVIEYLHSGQILPDHEVWSSIDTFRWGRRGEPGGKSVDETASTEVARALTGLSLADESGLEIERPILQHPFELFCATGFPKYTNFVEGFKDTLDYIFVEKEAAQILGIAPLPTEEQLSENTALPSQNFPSDHIAVMADILFSDKEVDVDMT